MKKTAKYLMLKRALREKEQDPKAIGQTRERIKIINFQILSIVI